MKRKCTLNFLNGCRNVFAVVLMLFVFCQNIYSQKTFYTDFEAYEPGLAFTRDLWLKDGFITGSWDNGLATRTMVDDQFSASGNNSLRVFFPKGAFGPQQGGAQVLLMLPPKDEYYFSYNIRFGENFSWGQSSQGGKIPGLVGGDQCGRNFDCNGTNGFIAYFMWREGGRGVSYLLYMDKKSDYGDDFQLKYPDGENVVFKPGEWYHIQQRIKMNTGANKNGIVEVWINGEEVLSINDIRFISNGDKINKASFVTFHGGNTPGWAPANDCYIWFDDVKISTEKE